MIIPTDVLNKLNDNTVIIYEQQIKEKKLNTLQRLLNKISIPNEVKELILEKSEKCSTKTLEKVILPFVRFIKKNPINFYQYDSFKIDVVNILSKNDSTLLYTFLIYLLEPISQRLFGKSIYEDLKYEYKDIFYSLKKKVAPHSIKKAPPKPIDILVYLTVIQKIISENKVPKQIYDFFDNKGGIYTSFLKGFLLIENYKKLFHSTLLSITTGLRSVEISRIKKEDLLENNYFIIRGKAKKNTAIQLDNFQKEQIIELLKNYWENNKIDNAFHIYFIHPTTGEKKIYYHRYEPLFRKAVHFSVIEYCKQAAPQIIEEINRVFNTNLPNDIFKPFGFHQLRHWYGTLLYYKTKDILLVKEMMRHSDIKYTLTYVKYILDEDRSPEYTKWFHDLIKII